MTPPQPPTREESRTQILSLREAAFGYADRVVLSGVSLDLHQGEALAVLGPNGSGKSTLVKGILGLARQFAGSVQLFGEPAASFRDHARIGYVPQRHTLSTSVKATASEVVSCGLLVGRRIPYVLSRADKSRVGECLDLVGLADQARSQVNDLSGGQQRRVLIARALACRPDALLMDEPTAGVDASSQHVLGEVLRRLRAERGVTLLVVTHELGALNGVFSRVAIIDEGQLTWDGPIDEFERRQSELVHDHDSHHHAIEWPDPGLLPTDFRRSHG